MSLQERLRAILRVIGPSALVLAPCGPSVTNLVLPLYLASYPSDSGGCVDKDTALLLANSLIQLADEKILAYNYKDVPFHWRMLYTDVTLAKAISILSLKSALKRVVMDLIRELDLVLIVAGAPGEGRTQMVHDLIEVAQDALLAGKKTASRPAKTIKLIESKVPSPYITHDIPRLSSPPPFGELPHLLKSPFIITGGCKDWPAVASWRSFDHLRRVGGTGRVVPVETGGNYTSEGWGQKIILWEDFLKALEGKSEDDSKQYLAQHDLFRQFPQLRREIVVPDYVYTVMQAPEGVEYVAPTSEDGYLTNVWLGPAGTVSPAHTDPYYNCYSQIVGKKWIWIAPPSSTPSMYTYGSSTPPLPSSDGSEDTSTAHYMTNTSQIDVTLSPSSKSYDRAPLFLENIAPLAQQAVLEEGDMLFIPAGWWHSMKSLSVSFSVSIWF